ATGCRAGLASGISRPAEQRACRRRRSSLPEGFPKLGNAGVTAPRDSTGTRVGLAAGMDFAVSEEIERLCEGVRRFMDEHVYPLERAGEHRRMEVGGPAYPPVIRAVHAKAKALGYWAFHLPRDPGGARIPVIPYRPLNHIPRPTPPPPLCPP